MLLFSSTNYTSTTLEGKIYIYIYFKEDFFLKLFIIFPTNSDTSPFRSRCRSFYINTSACTINTTGLHWQQVCRPVFTLEVTVKKNDWSRLMHLKFPQKPQISLEERFWCLSKPLVTKCWF